MSSFHHTKPLIVKVIYFVGTSTPGEMLLTHFVLPLGRNLPWCMSNGSRALGFAAEFAS